MCKKERGHFDRVGKLCKAFGEKMNLDENKIKELELCGLYHDIGKVSIPRCILDKPGKLTEEEYEIVKMHTMYSHDILCKVSGYAKLAEYVLYHHERWDGQGYPNGITGSEIPLISRIICVADSYDAMVSERAYKDTMSKEEAIEELYKCSGKQFDPEIVESFINKVLN